MQRNEFKEFFYLDFKAFELHFEQNIESLLYEVKEGIYKPQNCEKYYMPKKKNLARPISVLNLLDQIVYQAIANVIADIMYPVMSRYFNINTFGNIFVPTSAVNSMFFYEKWERQWKKYNQSKRVAYADGYSYSAEFDIASFYDTIDHGILLFLLSENGADSELIGLFRKCLSAWTISSTSSFTFTKSCGIPQGPLSSAFFAEIYLFNLDEEMRKKKGIQYMRYADDISIMASTEQECLKMIVYLDLLARDLSLIPQSEKIEVTHIDNIEQHINFVTSRFSTISKEFKESNSTLGEHTHKKLKKQFINTITYGEYNKTILRFALFKLNKDEEIKKIIIENIKQMELYYDGIIYYFNRYYANDDQFDQHIRNYLLSETVLFQYNKSLLFKKYLAFPFNEKIFRDNLKSEQRFWIVRYRLIEWLKRNKRISLVIECFEGNNYYIQCEINSTKMQNLDDDEAKKIFLEKLIDDPSPLVSIQGLYLWNHFAAHLNIEVQGTNGYSKKILIGEKQDYFSSTILSLYKLTVPKRFLDLISSNPEVYMEAKVALRDYLNYKDINPGLSLMSLDLFHNIIFDIITIDRKYTLGEFGAGLSQMEEVFPLAYLTFKRIHDTRNQRTYAHYKDKRTGYPRTQIKKPEYDELIKTAKLREAYEEIFKQYSRVEKNLTSI